MEYEEIEVNSERWFDLTPLLNEEFRDIIGYENLYQISNYGRVKSLIKYNYYTKKYYYREKILKCLIHKNNYLKVGLNKNKIKKSYLINQLVAKAFIPNTNNLPEVNHKDTNKYNNKVNNLEWCTRSENMIHAYQNNLCNNQIQHLYIIHKKNEKKVIQKTMNNEIIKIWSSIAQIERELGYNHSNINKCCLNKPHYLSAYKCKWEYIEE